MLCCACQEQPAEVDLGCQHFYCKNCLEVLGGNCRDGCEPISRISVEDAKTMLSYEERKLETLELSVSKEINKAERKLRELVSRLKGDVEAQYAKVKKAETCLEAQVARSYEPLVSRTIAVKEYAKVHLESNCVYDSESTYFCFSYRKDPYGNRHVQIKGNDNELFFDLQSLYDFVPSGCPPHQTKNKNTTLYLCKHFNRRLLRILAKSKSYLLLEHRGPYTNRYIVDLEKRTAERTNIKIPESHIPFFRGSDLVTYPAPLGFSWHGRGIAIRAHEDRDKFELFDPSVGKLELLVADVSRGLASLSISLEHSYSSRASVTLATGDHLSIPYLD
jgi:hypothetical protein